MLNFRLIIVHGMIGKYCLKRTILLHKFTRVNSAKSMVTEKE